MPYPVGAVAVAVALVLLNVTLMMFWCLGLEHNGSAIAVKNEIAVLSESYEASSWTDAKDQQHCGSDASQSQLQEALAG